MVDDISKAIKGSGSEPLTTVDGAASKVEMRPLRDDEPSDEILRNAKNGHVRGDSHPHIELTNKEGFNGDVIFTMPYSLDNLKLYVEPFGKGLRGDLLIDYRNRERLGDRGDTPSVDAVGRYSPQQLSRLRRGYKKEVEDIKGLDTERKRALMRMIREANLANDDARAALYKEIEAAKAWADVHGSGEPIVSPRPIGPAEALTTDKIESFRATYEEALQTLRRSFEEKNISNTEILHLLTETKHKIRTADTNVAFEAIIRELSSLAG